MKQRMKLVVMSHVNKEKIRSKSKVDEDPHYLENLVQNLHILKDIKQIQLKLVFPYDENKDETFIKLFEAFPNLSVIYFY